MANVIITNLPAGIDTSKYGFESPVKNIVITKADQNFASVTAAAALSAWTALLGALTAYVPNGLANYEPGAAEPKLNTTAMGRQFVSQEGVPTAKLQLETSSGDFAELIGTLKGGLYRIYFLLENGNVKGTIGTDGIFRGFLARAYAYSPGVQVLDKQEDFYPVQLLFQNTDEFKDAFVLGLTWNSDRELVAAMPFGLTITKTAAYDTVGGIQKIYVASRGGDDYVGLAVVDFTIVNSNVVTPAVTTVTDNGNGLYDLVLNKEATPLPLAAGDYFAFKVAKGTPITAVSNIVTLNL